MHTTIRTFIAVDISPDIRSIIQKRIKPLIKAYPNVKWVDDRLFHITLKFLGNVPLTEIHLVVEAVRRAALKKKAFDLVLDGIGAFPTLNDPSSFWVAIQDGMEELSELALLVEEELVPLNFPQERRPFSPHLTIGRLRPSKKKDMSFVGIESLIADKIKDTWFGCCSIDEVVVYSSELHPDGPDYEPLGTAPLRVL